MPDIDVKICGIATASDFDACASAGARFVGMVFFARSPRHLSYRQAAALADHAAGYGEKGPKRVALTVNMDDREMAAMVAAANPHFLQLHGDETPARASALKAHFGLPIIKAIRVETTADLDSCAAWDGIADWLLFDAKGEPDGLPGGTGHHFDWRLLASKPCETKWMLAGGLSPENVKRAIAVTGAKAVDVSSGVESSPGKKDPRLIHTFVSATQMG